MRNEDGKSYAALGLFPKIAYPTTRRPLLAGDKVMLFTDGLYEVEGRNDELYSQEMLLAAVRRHAQRPCAEMFDAVLAEVRQFSDNKPFVDDVCLVGMEVAQPPAT